MLVRKEILWCNTGHLVILTTVKLLKSLKFEQVDKCYHFVPYLSTNSGFLQQVLLYLGSLYGSSLVEMDVDVFSKTRRVVVADCFSVAKG